MLIFLFLVVWILSFNVILLYFLLDDDVIAVKLHFNKTFSSKTTFLFD